MTHGAPPSEVELQQVLTGTRKERHAEEWSAEERKGREWNGKQRNGREGKARERTCPCPGTGTLQMPCLGHINRSGHVGRHVATTQSPMRRPWMNSHHVGSDHILSHVSSVIACAKKNKSKGGGDDATPAAGGDGGEAMKQVEAETREKMDKSLDSVKRNFSTVRTGRASPSMVDRITVDYYGTPTPLPQMANVTTPEASLLVIQPYDISVIPDIERAIIGSDLDITPNNDGKIIRLQVPPLTADRRKEMTKVTSKMGEEGKVAVRNVRRDALKRVEKLEKDGVIGEDGKKDLENTVQKLTDDFVKQIDDLIKAKSDELTKV